MNSTKGVVHVCLKRGASSIMRAEHALVTNLGNVEGDEPRENSRIGALSTKAFENISYTYSFEWSVSYTDEKL